MYRLTGARLDKCAVGLETDGAANARQHVSSSSGKVSRKALLVTGAAAFPVSTVTEYYYFTGVGF
jgi:hypothetical protein